MTNIELKQKPVIVHQLQEAGKKVTERIDSLELDKQVATEETVKSLKSTRAELNKELADFESQRKAIKDAVSNPYLEFESVYKIEISEKYKAADTLLKDKIDLVEDKVKTEKKNVLIDYFTEFCASMQIDFIQFDNLNLNITLSTSEKKYKEQINEFINKVNDDLMLIKSTDFEAEIMAEYKKTLNASAAITSVKTRKENERLEAERIKAQAKQNRITYLEKLGFLFVSITNSYEYNADIYVTVDEIESLSKEDFTKKYAECEAKILDLKQSELVKEVNSNFKRNPIFSPVEEPIQAPKVEQLEPLKTASFQVTATMTQLRALGQYMKDNNITYKNI